jgi:hypothetical protein
MLRSRQNQDAKGGADMDHQAEIREDSNLLAHERTYHAFNLLLHWCMVALGASLLFLTMWFATPAGFFAALVTGIVVFFVGYALVIREKEH